MIVLTATLALLLLVLTCRFGLKGLARLGDLNIQGGWFLLMACASQVLSMIIQQQRLWFLVVTAAFLLWFCWLNRRQVGMMLITIGISLNMIVMAANGGTMPVSPATLATMRGVEVESGFTPRFSKSVVLHDEAAALPWLSDRLLLPGPLTGIAAWSIGDMFLILGVARLLWHTMKGTNDDARESLRRGASLS